MQPTRVGLVAILGILALLLPVVIENGFGSLISFVLGSLFMYTAVAYRLDHLLHEVWAPQYDTDVPMVFEEIDMISSDVPSDDSYKEAVNEMGVTLEDSIGSGSYGIVFKGHHMKSGRKVAVKVIKKPVGHSERSLEIKVLKRLSGKSHHFVKFVDAKDTGEYEIIAMEYCSHGNLTQVLGKIRNQSFSESLFCKPAYTGAMFKVLEIFVQVAHGLIELHREGLAHGDITPRNILLSELEFDKKEMPCCRPHYTHLSRMFRLADFGISRRIRSDGKVTTCKGRGTKRYRAPEVNPGQRFNGIKADAYSFGVMLYEALTTDLLEHVRTADGQDYIIERTPINLHDLGGPARVPLYGWWSVNPAILGVLRSFLRPSPDDRGTLDDFISLFKPNSAGQRDITKTAAVPFDYPTCSESGNRLQTVDWIAEIEAEAMN